MHASKWYGIGAGLVVLGMFAMAQESAPKQDKVIKHVPVKATNAASGQEMYTNYCAVCHGADGKGGGPAASALKVAPHRSDRVGRKKQWQIPGPSRFQVLRGDAELAAHGNKDMPVWGPVFRHLSQGHDAEVQQRIANLNQYVASIQNK